MAAFREVDCNIMGRKLSSLFNGSSECIFQMNEDSVGFYGNEVAHEERDRIRSIR